MLTWEHVIPWRLKRNHYHRTNVPGAIKSAHVIPDLNHKTCILCRTKSLAIFPSQSRTSITRIYAPKHLTTTSIHSLLSLLALDGFAVSRQREKVRWKEIKTRSAEHSVRWVTLGTAGSIPHRPFMLQYKRLMSACPSVRSIEGKASFAYTLNEMDRYSSWMEEGRKLNEKRTGKGKRERERDNMNPRPDAGLLLHLQTRSSNRQTKPVATLPGWDYYTRDLNNKYVRVSCATGTCLAFKRVHECDFSSIRRALPMPP